MSNILIVGASSGIGKETALALKSKYRVFALARRFDKLKELEGVEPIEFDVRNLSKIDSLMKNLAKEYGKFKGLIYCAGIQLIKPIRVLKPNEIEEIFKINTIAFLLFAQSFSSKRVCDRDNLPSIVAISSIAANKPEKGIIPYSASKSALNSIIMGLAKELAPIRVNGVAPGFLETEMTKRFSNIYNEEFINRVKEEYPLGLGKLKDISNLIEFLLSKEAKYITGEIIRVDGGGAL